MPLLHDEKIERHVRLDELNKLGVYFHDYKFPNHLRQAIADYVLSRVKAVIAEFPDE